MVTALIFKPITIVRPFAERVLRANPQAKLSACEDHFTLATSTAETFILQMFSIPPLVSGDRYRIAAFHPTRCHFIGFFDFTLFQDYEKLPKSIYDAYSNTKHEMHIFCGPLVVDPPDLDSNKLSTLNWALFVDNNIRKNFRGTGTTLLTLGMHYASFLGADRFKLQQANYEFFKRFPFDHEFAYLTADSETHSNYFTANLQDPASFPLIGIERRII